MDSSSNLLNAPREFLVLFRAGKEAARRGDNAQAHELFRKAIEIDPYHEQVWLWLASVVESDEDQRVCFENVLELNPDNPTARRQIAQLEQKALDEALHGEQPAAKKPARIRRWRRWLLVLIVLLAAVGAALVASGVI